MKIYVYLDKESGKTIGIYSKQKPRIRRFMHVVYEWNCEKKEYLMATFPEITDKLLFSDRFLLLGFINSK